mmetsp:Transcript_28920/g.99698  ORF Transcript_28920/g.99698 Transcript_28920/m.99698 type:complete len:209 (-) Transcript_28920:333-959(-)
MATSAVYGASLAIFVRSPSILCICTALASHTATSSSATSVVASEATPLVWTAMACARQTASCAKGPKAAWNSRPKQRPGEQLPAAAATCTASAESATAQAACCGAARRAASAVTAAGHSAPQGCAPAQSRSRAAPTQPAPTPRSAALRTWRMACSTRIFCRGVPSMIGLKTPERLASACARSPKVDIDAPTQHAAAPKVRAVGVGSVA